LNQKTRQKARQVVACDDAFSSKHKSVIDNTHHSTADLIARFLKSQGIQRVYGLCGGHIMPIWMRLDAHGIQIIDTRDERAAVYMAHAEAELTGRLGVALVTAGPGVTNAITGIANAHVARASVLVLSGTTPGAQENRGGLQDMLHTDMLKGITRLSRTVRHPDLVLAQLNEAVAACYGVQNPNAAHIKPPARHQGRRM
jgi:acetolactate synthase-1/2/3 large subunit